MDLTKINRSKSTENDEKKENILDREITLFGSKKLSEKQRSGFFQQVSTLLLAGLDLSSTLNQLVTVTADKKLKIALSSVLDDLIKGKTFSESLSNEGSFSNYELVSIEVGEASGKLATTLEELYDYLSNRIKLRKQIISALSYPMLIFFSSVGAVLFMILFVVPIFEEVFRQFQGELPVLTRVVINISKSIKTYFLMFLVISGLVFMAIRVLSRQEFFKEFVHPLIFKIPVFGSVVKYSIIARFCNGMSLLLSSNVPLLDSLELITRMNENRGFEQHIKKIIEEIKKGSSFYEAIRHSNFFDSDFIILIKVSEESATLPKFFRQLSLEYQTKINDRTQVLNAVLEPLLIVLLGAMVALILVSMYLPMFDLSTKMTF